MLGYPLNILGYRDDEVLEVATVAMRHPRMSLVSQWLPPPRVGGAAAARASSAGRPTQPRVGATLWIVGAALPGRVRSTHRQESSL